MCEWMIGRIEEQDFAGSVHRYRVRLADGQLTAWLPKLNPFADGSTTDKPLGINTQVVVLLARDREEGVILGTLNCNAYPDPADRDTLHRTRYADGAVIEYDIESHQLNAILPSGATTHLTSDGGVTVDGDTAINGNLTVNGNATVSGNVAIGGNLDLSGNGTVGGNFTISGICAVGGLTSVSGGAVSATGGLSMQGGDIIADGISLKGHTHPGDSGGTTGAPQ